MDIVARNSMATKDVCSEHGTLNTETGLCQCDSKFYGERCQYENECELDSDCGNGR